MKKILSILTILAVIFSCTLAVIPASATNGTALTNLYNENYYVTHGNASAKAEFDNENKTITVDGINKAMIGYTDEMTDFDASITMQCNSKGAIYAGFGFHLSRDDFKTAAFNTEGYSVIVKNNSETNNYKDVRIIIRYITNGTVKDGEIVAKYANVYTGADTTRKLKLDLKVDSENFTINVTDAKTNEKIVSNLSYPLDNKASKPNSGVYTSGNLAVISNGIHTFTDFAVTSYGSMTVPEEENSGATPPPPAEPTDPLDANFVTYGELTTENGLTSTTQAAARGLLKSTVATPVSDFSADITLKAGSGGALKAGMVFRVGDIKNEQNGIEGYAFILQKTSNGPRLYLYKYGYIGSALKYLGRIAYVAGDIAITEGAEYVIHANVIGEKVQAYYYNAADPSVKSKLLSATLKTPTDNETNSPNEYPTVNIYYSQGAVGFHAAKDGGYVDALNFTVKAPEEMLDDSDNTQYPGGEYATENSKGSAVKGQVTLVTGIDGTATENKVTIEEYSSDFDNFTYYSSSTSNKFLRTGEDITSTSTGAKRAILDGVTVKGFHATATMQISNEGTLRSGIVFRVNDIEKGLDENGALASNNLEGYAAILYKTPGTTTSYARVVLCVYKYGVKNGAYQFLGTVASKASEIPLTGCEKSVFDAAGKKLTIDVNVIDDQITAYFYNADDPTLKSEKLVTDLFGETDIEKSTPSLAGTNYKSGAIGLTATDYVTFTDFTVGEPQYPSNDVGLLSELDSYTIYGSGVNKEGEYFTANSSGTKKMIVNNLTVTDFTASVDMTIDDNGNLKAGFFFRANEIGNGADDQTGYAAIVTRNYSTLGETNPNRIDIVVFKWGYNKGKLAYLGEVAREAFKSGATFMDGKMAGEELTFVVSVKGAGLDATLYHKKDMTNKPATFFTNLKFAASKEKEDIAYFESGSVGLYLGNSVSDPLNYTKVRNFHLDDGSDVLVKAKAGSNSSGKLSSLLPSTGEGMLIMIVCAIFVISAGTMFSLKQYSKRGRHEKTGESVL